MTFYALIENGEIARLNIQLPTVIGNTSIPDGASNVSEFGLYPIVGTEPSYDSATQRLAGPAYVFDGEQVNRVYTVENISTDELNRVRKQAILAELSAIDLKSIRALREGYQPRIDELDAQAAALRAEMAAL